MIVLIEGVDGSGKSTLCETLRNSGYIVSNIEQDENQSVEYVRRARGELTYICDRSFLSDLVYRLEDGKPRQGMNLYSMLAILSQGCKVIICKTGSEYKDSMARGETNITSKYRNTVIRAYYDKVAQLLKDFANVPVKYYNWKTDDISDVINFIERR